MPSRLSASGERRIKCALPPHSLQRNGLMNVCSLTTKERFSTAPPPTPDGCRYAGLQKPRNLDQDGDRTKKAVQKALTEMELGQAQTVGPAVETEGTQRVGGRFSQAMWSCEAVCRLERSVGSAVPFRGDQMQQSRKFRRFAARCLEEARGTIDPRLKAFLAEMAQEWQRLAEQAKSEVHEHHVQGPQADPGD